MYSHFSFLLPLFLISVLAANAFEFDVRNGLPLFSSGNRGQTPLMAVIQDSRFAQSDQGYFQIRSSSDLDIWKNFTVQKFTPPYRIETSLRMDAPSAPGAGVLFCLSGKGDLLVGLNKTGASRFRMEGTYRKGNWKLGEWVPVRIDVEKDRITMKNGDDSFSYRPKGSVAEGPIGIDVYCATGAWKPIRISTPEGKLLFEEKWDGKTAGQWFSPGKRMLEFFKACGVGVYQVNLELKRSLQKDGSYDFSSFDTCCRDLLAVHPDAFLIARTWVDSGKAARQETVSTDGKKKRRFDWSYADPAELKRQQDFLKAFLAHADREVYGRFLAGLLLMSGNGGEFVYHFDHYRFSDYSAVHRAAFQTYLKNRYAVIDALNQSWKSAWKDFFSIPIPSPRERVYGQGNPLVLTPEKDQYLIDYQTFHNENIVCWIHALTRTIKENSKLPRIVGAYYGYTAVATGSIFNKGHNALYKLLETEIDFISCPYQYRNRTAGNPIIFQLPYKSASLHGKQIFFEDDSRTFFCANHSDPFREATLKDSREILKRNFIHTFSANAGLWYLDFGANWFAHPELQDVIAKIASCYQSRAEGKLLPRQNRAVALISEQAFSRMRHKPDAVFEPVFRQLADVISVCGVPFDVALLSDLEKLPTYTFYFVLNRTAAPEEEKKAVERLRQKIGDRLYAPEGFQCTPAPELRAKLLKAGLTPISEDPIAVYRGKNWLGIHTLQANPTLKLRIPESMGKVTEVFTGKSYTVKDHQLILPVQRGETYLWTWE